MGRIFEQQISNLPHFPEPSRFGVPRFRRRLLPPRRRMHQESRHCAIPNETSESPVLDCPPNVLSLDIRVSPRIACHLIRMVWILRHEEKVVLVNTQSQSKQHREANAVGSWQMSVRYPNLSWPTQVYLHIERLSTSRTGRGRMGILSKRGHKSWGSVRFWARTKSWSTDGGGDYVLGYKEEHELSNICV